MFTYIDKVELNDAIIQVIKAWELNDGLSNFSNNFVEKVISTGNILLLEMKRKKDIIAYAIFEKDNQKLLNNLFFIFNPNVKNIKLLESVIQAIVNYFSRNNFLNRIFVKVKKNDVNLLNFFIRQNFYIENIDKEHFNLKMEIKIKRREKKKVFIIAEAGSNWRMGTMKRDIKMGKALIDVAVEAGADAVKFQTYRPETVYVPNAGNSDYLSKNGIKESITDIFKDLSMPYEIIPLFAEYAKKNGIEFMSTPFSVNDARAIDPFVKRHKLASYEITHIRLIEFLAKTGKPLIMSTGGSNFDDIAWALQYFYEKGGKDITILQCTAKYPAPLSTLNLSVLQKLHNDFDVPIGLSDHSRDPIIGPVGAVALGATVIEKHFTLHNKLPGADHSFAVTPDELKKMVTEIRKMEEALGEGKKQTLKAEKELRDYAFRGIQAIKNIKIGDIFSEGENIDILRPGKQKKGIHPKYIDDVVGKKAKRNITLGDGIQREDF